MARGETLDRGAGGTVRVLYGSETGNAEFLCDDLMAALAERGIAASASELDDVAPIELSGLGTALVIVSTTGDGDMPYGAGEFWDSLESDETPKCDGLRYAVLALGDSTYPYFCEAGTRIDERLADLGATRIADRVECDAAYDRKAAEWIADRVHQLVERVDPVGGAANIGADGCAAPVARPDGPSDTARDGRPSWTREHPFQAAVTAVTPLSGPADREVVEIELDLSDADIGPLPGDSIGIVARNEPFATSRFLAVARLDGTEMVGDEPCGLLARDRWELRFPSGALLAETARRAPGTDLGCAVISGDRSWVDNWTGTHTVADVLALMPEPPDVEALAALMTPVRARAFSLAGIDGARVRIAVAVERPGSATMRAGVASGFLAERVAVGDRIDTVPMPNRAFRLPCDPTKPIIMVGTGVGVAPFRAFLIERARTAGAGPAWLFFGNRHEQGGFLYRADWQELSRAGALSRIDTAFSRDQPQKIYVQHLMRTHGAEIVRWLAGGAVLYVCGDAEAMASDVRRAVHDVLVEHLGSADGGALFAAMRSEQRYLEDVY